MMNLLWVLATIEDFNNANINITTERKSVDNSKAIKHISLLTVEEWENIRYNSNFIFLDQSDCEILMKTSEWNSEDI